MPNAVRVLIADDHPAVRQGLCELLSTRLGLVVCAEARNGQDALEKARDLKPDLVILDVAMPQRDGFTVAREIRKFLPHARILMFSTHHGLSLDQTARKVGANGFVVKTDPGDVLLSAVDAVMEGGEFFSSERMKCVERSRSRGRSNVA